jgi:branched-chain amino acid transport system ATP-binding protein
MADAVFKVRDLEVRYGTLTALQGVSFRVDRGEIVTLIGANGAGKTTLLALSGLLSPARGGIVFEGRPLAGKAAEDIVRAGTCQSPEGRRVFAGMTVQDNLDVAATPWRRRGESLTDDIDRVYGLFSRLAERRGQLAWSMLGGEQQMLTVGSALMGRPELLLLYEPSLGLALLVV